MRKFAIWVSLLFLLLGCGQDLTEGIVGFWQGKKQNLVFYADGRVELVSQTNTVYDGTYQLDGKAVKCDFERFIDPVIRQAKLDGDELILTDKNGIDEVYHRQE